MPNCWYFFFKGGLRFFTLKSDIIFAEEIERRKERINHSPLGLTISQAMPESTHTSFLAFIPSSLVLLASSAGWASIFSLIQTQSEIPLANGP
jgi:hypothetical protein